MKLGTENKNKTIFALVLAGIALILVARWLLTSPSSTEASPPSKAAVSSNHPASEPAQPTTRAGAQRPDQKTLGVDWKPSLDPQLELAKLNAEESIEYKGLGRNIFEMNSQPEIPEPVASAMIHKAPSVTQQPVNQGPLPPPPINLKFYGYSTRNGQRTVFLSQGKDSVFVAHEGDTIARRYKVVRINPNSVEIQDMLSNNKQTIPLSAS